MENEPSAGTPIMFGALFYTQNLYVPPYSNYSLLMYTLEMSLFFLTNNIFILKITPVKENT